MKTDTHHIEGAQECHGHCSCHSHEHSHEHGHEHGGASGARAWIMPGISFVLMIAGILMSHFHAAWFENHTVELLWYVAAFLPVGLPVIKEAAEGIASGDFFNEFTLMAIACVGAFCIGEFPEAVGVMLFYSVGEMLQARAVSSATRDISKLLDVRSQNATVFRDGAFVDVDPKTVKIGETLAVSPGERVPLDGVITGDEGIFDTSALTGESMPRTIADGGEVLAGMICTSKAARMRVTKGYDESALAKILDMVKNASSRKAHAELFIRKFARVYTPIVIVLAVLLVAVPALVGLVYSGFHYDFSEWLYRGLVFLVISCPCALVISVPLGYYAGIGAASKAGILFKGGNYLEAVTHVNTVAFDKTGTLTTGKFSVESVVSESLSKDKLLGIMASAESQSTHPLAKALVEYAESKNIAIARADSMQEIAGHGAKASVGGRNVVVGNMKMMKSEGIVVPDNAVSADGTVILCGIDGEFAGYAVLADTLKPDSAAAVERLRRLGVKDVVMLSGDKGDIVERYAEKLGITEAHGNLLPQDKAEYVEKMAKTPGCSIAFVGDGMNDAPVLALSNVGIAMGGLGSDAAIESADVVIQTDQPSKVATAIEIGRTTHTIVMENIVGAISVKVIVLALGAVGIASLWGAVFADVGVALLAVLNSMRIMWKRYR